MLRILVLCVFSILPFSLFADGENEIPDREPDVVSIPANLSDYYIYDSETNDWIWAEDYKAEHHQRKIPVTLPKVLKKQKPKLAKKAPGVEILRNKTEAVAIKKSIDDSDAWVIIARGVDRSQIETKFMTLDKKKYELCRFDRNTTSLDCTVDINY